MRTEDEIGTTALDAACERAHRQAVAVIAKESGFPEAVVDVTLRVVTERHLKDYERKLIHGEGTGEPPRGLMQWEDD